MRISTSSWGQREGDLVTSVNRLGGGSNTFGFILHSTQRTSVQILNLKDEFKDSLEREPAAMILSSAILSRSSVDVDNFSC